MKIRDDMKTLAKVKALVKTRLVKALAVAVTLAAFGGLATASDGIAAPVMAPLARPAVVPVDWQYPPQLPRRFRNHCAIHTFTGRPYCSDHCGYDYQFYFCSPQSFGCCRIGFGYCDWSGLLRCAP
jgi:hypothetical protein